MKKDKHDKFKMLKTFTVVLRVLAWVTLAGGIVATVEVVIDPSMVTKLGLTNIYNSSWLMGLAVLIGSVAYSMIFLALSEAVQAFLSIEGNTRKLRELLDKK